MRDFYERNRIRIHNAAYTACFLLAVYVAFRYVLGYVLPFVIGLLIAAALSPLADRIERRFHVNRSALSAALIILCVALLATFGTMGITRARREVETLAADMPQLTERMRGFAAGVRQKVDAVAAFVPDDYREAFDKSSAQLTSAAIETLTDAARSYSVRAVVSIPNAVIATVLSILSAYFFIKDGKLIRASLSKLIGSTGARQMSLIQSGMVLAAGGYVRAQLVLMALVGSICALGLALMGNPYAILIAAVAAFIDALPVFGLGAVFWPWCAYAFLSGDARLGVGLAIIYGTAFLTRHLLEPKIVGQQIGVHPLLTLFSLYIGLKLLGIPGLLIGPMAVITLKMALVKSNESTTAPSKA